MGEILQVIAARVFGSCPFSSLSLHPCVIGDAYATVLVIEGESGCAEHIPSLLAHLPIILIISS